SGSVTASRLKGDLKIAEGVRVGMNEDLPVASKRNELVDSPCLCSFTFPPSMRPGLQVRTHHYQRMAGIEREKYAIRVEDPGGTMRSLRVDTRGDGFVTREQHG